MFFYEEPFADALGKKRLYFRRNMQTITARQRARENGNLEAVKALSREIKKLAIFECKREIPDHLHERLYSLSVCRRECDLSRSRVLPPATGLGVAVEARLPPLL